MGRVKTFGPEFEDSRFLDEIAEKPRFRSRLFKPLEAGQFF